MPEIRSYLMTSLAVPLNLIISLSNDKVTVDLAGLPEKGMVHWRTAFDVEGIFEEEKMAKQLDELMISRPELMEPFDAVEIVLLDRPHLSIPDFYRSSPKLASLASRHLRIRAGDMLNLDPSVHQSFVCYTVPYATVQMLREYYSNISVTHYTSVVWQYLLQQNLPDQATSVAYFHLFGERLIVMGVKEHQLHFTKTFTIRDSADVVYYAVSCSRMLKADKHCQLLMEEEVAVFDMPATDALKMDEQVWLPSYRNILAQYRECVS